jgi:hypothetical protein
MMNSNFVRLRAISLSGCTAAKTAASREPLNVGGMKGRTNGAKVAQPLMRL